MPIRCRAALLPLLAACALTSCTSAPSKPDRPVPVSRAELQALLPGHYFRGCSGLEPLDSGPLILQPGGDFEKVTGFASYRGRYEIEEGQVTYRGVQNGEPFQWTDRFFKDPGGRLRIHRGMGGTPSEPHLRVIDRFARDLGCPDEDRRPR